MNRLQKKCFIATAGVHLLLLVILIVGPAFFQPRPKADDLNMLDVIPANLIDAQFSSGIRNAQPPPPAPVVTPPQSQPPPPLPPPKPAESSPSFVEKMEKIFKSEPAKPEPHKIQVNTQLVARTGPRNTSTSDNSAQRARALRKAIQNLKKNFSSNSKVDMPGNSTAAYASYDSAVKSVYYQAWMQILLDTVAKNGENVIVHVTIANDGTVLSASIVTPSGDQKVDESVRRTLERVKFIAPFPEGATEKERSYTINFNTTVANQMLE
jgi:TonB family protein